MATEYDYERECRKIDEEHEKMASEIMCPNCGKNLTRAIEQARQDERKKCIDAIYGTEFIIQECLDNCKKGQRDAIEEYAKKVVDKLNQSPKNQDYIIDKFKKSQRDAEDFRTNDLPSISPKRNKFPKNQEEK